MGGFLACILAGAAMSIQGVMNTRLSEHIGTMETNAFVQCVAAVLSLLVLAGCRGDSIPKVKAGTSCGVECYSTAGVYTTLRRSVSRS